MFLVQKVRLVSYTKPGQGYIELLEDSKPKTWQRLCNKDLKDKEKNVICRTLGYSGVQHEQSSVGSGQETLDFQEPIFYGNLYCNSQDNNVSSCCLEKVDSYEDGCSTMAHVSC